MSVWSGWQADLLTHSGLPNTTDNRSFLTDWHNHAETNCQNNPVDLSVSAGVGSNCASLPGLTAKAQKYPTSGDAVHAWSVQIGQSAYAALRAAMLTGDPYSANNTGDAASAIASWGSRTFSQRFFNETGDAPGRGGGGEGGGAPRAHGGWADLRRSVNHHMPDALRASQKNTRAALRSLSRARKVRL